MAAPYYTAAQLQKLFTIKDKGFKISTGEGRIYGHLTLKDVNSNMLDVKISVSETYGESLLSKLTLNIKQRH
jgi:hypothetical protein